MSWTGPGDGGETQGLVRIAHHVRLLCKAEGKGNQDANKDADREHTTRGIAHKPQYAGAQTRILHGSRTCFKLPW